MTVLKKLIRSLPYISRLHHQNSRLRAELQQWRTWKPPGHFYSPIPDLDELARDSGRIFSSDKEILGLDLNRERQLSLLGDFSEYHHELPAAWAGAGQSRYRYENEYYSWADGIVLYSFLRHVKPKRVTEVGSGFSSALLLDTNDMFFGAQIECTFIDPYPERLRGLLRTEDASHCRVLESRVQDVDLTEFLRLQPGDILLIDSSHVSKTGSDLNHILFEIIPRLNKGVLIHFHDIFYPFEYPHEWVEMGISWNEAYILRAFLSCNSVFKIQFFTSYLLAKHRDAVEKSIPLTLNSERDCLTLSDAPGSSLWLCASE